MRVELKGIWQEYGDFVAVRDLNLTIASGALHFFLGPSGCGKTTSLRMIAGLEQPTRGQILFGERDVTNVTAAERGIGMVFQNYALWPHMTVRENISYGLRLKKLAKQTITERLEEVLGYTQLGPFVDRFPGQLSGGQQQRVALARALAIRPHVLLLDEPLSNLDAKLRLEMRETIQRIHEEVKITMIYVTHDQKEALSMATGISVMRAGQLMQTAMPRELYHRPRSPFVATFIGETNLIEGRLVRRDRDRWIVATPEGEFHCQHAEGEFAPGDAVYVSVRPEAVAVGYGGAEFANESNRVRVRLERVTYLGDAEQVLGQGVEGHFGWRATVFNAPMHDEDVGDEVVLSFAAKDALVLQHGEGLDSGT